MNFSPETVVKGMIVAILAAGVSTHFIEEPIRSRRWLNTSSSAWALLLASVITSGLAFSLRRTLYASLSGRPASSIELMDRIDQASDHYAARLNLNYLASEGEEFRADLHHGHTCSLDDDFSQSPKARTLILSCLVESLGSAGGWLVIGDSHGRDFLHALRRKFPDTSFAMLHQSSCAPATYQKTERILCFHKLDELLFEEIPKNLIKGVILSSSYPRQHLDHVYKTMEHLSNLSVQSIVVGPSPAFRLPVSEIVLKEALPKEGSQRPDLSAYLNHRVVMSDRDLGKASNSRGGSA